MNAESRAARKYSCILQIRTARTAALAQQVAAASAPHQPVPGESEKQLIDRKARLAELRILLNVSVVRTAKTWQRLHQVPEDPMLGVNKAGFAAQNLMHVIEGGWITVPEQPQPGEHQQYQPLGGPERLAEAHQSFDLAKTAMTAPFAALGEQGVEILDQMIRQSPSWQKFVKPLDR